MSLSAVNFTTGMGSIFCDPSESLAITIQRLLCYEELDQLYSHSGIVHRYVTQLQKEVVSQATFEIAGAEQVEVDALLECISLHQLQKKLYGWSVFTLKDDGTPVTYSPSDVNYQFDWLAREPVEITPRYSDKSPRGRDQFFLSRDVVPPRHNWQASRVGQVYGSQIGITRLHQVWKQILRYELYQNVLHLTAERVNQDVMGVPDLVELAQSDDFDQYIANLTLTRSMLGVILTDEENGTYQINERRVDRVAEVLPAEQRIVATAVGWPESYLFCQSPSGSTSGQMDTQHWENLKLDEFAQMSKVVRWFCNIVGIDCKITMPRFFTLDEIAALVKNMVLTPEEGKELAMQKISPIVA
jgi:hypothetical protein